MQRSQRLEKELRKISMAPPEGISVSAKENQLNILEACVIGPDNSPYRNAIFNLEILVPENYPFSPPSIKFVTKVYHPNIDDNGRICLDLIKMPPKGSWRPTIGLEGLLIAIRMLLENPNPQDPLMIEIADEFINNRDQFRKKAEMHCLKYATITL